MKTFKDRCLSPKKLGNLAMRGVVREMWGLLTDGQRESLKPGTLAAARRIVDGETPEWLGTWVGPTGLDELERVLHTINACRLSGSGRRYVFAVDYEISAPETAGRDEVYWHVRLSCADKELVAALQEAFAEDPGIQNKVTVEVDRRSLLDVEPAYYWERG